MRRKLPLMVVTITALFISYIFVPVNSQADTQVPVTTNMATIASIASRQDLPILLVFSAKHCSYCELLEEEILKPMILSGDYRDRVLIYKVMLDGGNQIINFQGKPTTADELAIQYGVFVTPTMLFLDNQGKELSERLLGINTVEMFGGLVDKGIFESRQKLQLRKKRLVSNLQPIESETLKKAN